MYIYDDIDCHSHQRNDQEGHSHSLSATPSYSFSNIRQTQLSYWVKEAPKNMEKVFGSLVVKLCQQRVKMARVLIYCRRCEECASIYYFFRSQLQHEVTEPLSAPNLSCFRLVDMFTSITHKDVQESIITSFCQSAAPLRIVICTIAFGMGLDCADVSQVIHWGPASDLESYMQ